ncbi:hypothetical protein [Ruminococcus albus]|uniref:YolD-like protein n=1 Tax=Ruminococcus albus TaxID=1264 RepID=A0A1H7FBP9_RUMAL|nr:hypothetical protein [Ruminococcus albus]SEK23388.1 hypothetical protein SAMN05216469_101196 [Ruminococcus albus]
MFHDYSDIKDMSRPYYDDLPPMSQHDRAAQFASFAALTGYDDAVGETVRFTDCKHELDEDGINRLNSQLCRLMENISERPEIMAVYFLPDEKKSGGSYNVKRGAVRIIDTYENSLVFADGMRIPIVDLYSLEFRETENGALV